MNAIFERKSIRKYTDQPVPYEMIEKILEAGMCAPSAGNERPWHFVVLDDKNVINEIPKINPYANMLKEAQYAIVVCGDVNLVKMKQYQDFWIQDCSAATENMLIMAQHLGLGAVWLGVHPVQELVNAIRNLLQIPDHVNPLSIISIGYPAEQRDPGNRFDKTRIHLNKW